MILSLSRAKRRQAQAATAMPADDEDLR